jgi:hypothetical protein
MHYNFARVHKTLRCTPAMEAGIADHVWSLEEIVNLFIKLTTMKSKQLANVLIKMLGLSICVYAIPSFVEGVLVMLSGKPPTYFVTVLGISATAMSAIVQVIVGIVIITKSQKIAGWMFKSEDE